MAFPTNQTIEVLRQNALSIFQSGIASADPYQAVKRCLISDPDGLQIRLDVGKKRSGHWPKIHLIAFGKAACPMIKAAMECLEPHCPIGDAIAVTNYENVQAVSGAEVLGAAHPLPDEAGYHAAKRCAEIALNARAGELVLVLVSGGGSALLPFPVDSVSLHDKIRTTDLLLASGANINQVNCVRKHLSQLKGGGLAKLISPADCHALILSDVLGDDLSAIASGPTVPDWSTFADAVNLLEARSLWQHLPGSVRDYLAEGLQGKRPETPKASDRFFTKTGRALIGSNRISLDAVTKAAQNQGYETLMYSDHLCGETSEQAQKLVEFASKQNQGSHQTIAIVAGGETTVTLKGTGRGGRNQEMALAFAIEADKKKLTGNWVFLSGGTDGRDGPTDAAGGLVDSCTIRRMADAGINPQALLANNDSYHALKASNDLLMTGATGTNVADLQVLLIQN